MPSEVDDRVLMISWSMVSGTTMAPKPSDLEGMKEEVSVLLFVLNLLQNHGQEQLQVTHRHAACVGVTDLITKYSPTEREGSSSLDFL